MTGIRVCAFARAAAANGSTPEAYGALSTYKAAELLQGCKPTAVRLHRNGQCCCDTTPPPPPAPTPGEETAGQVTVTPEGGEFTNLRRQTPIGGTDDWARVFEEFDLDPARYAIADDTVRMSKWQTSRRTEDGDRDVVWLYSYSARFTTRKTEAEDGTRLADLIAHTRATAPTTPAPVATGSPVTLVVALADWQLGKGEGEGTQGTVRRITAALAKTQDYIARRQAEGHRIERILLANMGDHIEAVQGSYANQPATVDLNLRDQLSLALELNMAWIKAMAAHAPVTYTATLCNHGQWARAGHDSVMGDEDNATGFIGDQLATVCSHVPGLDVTFDIPRDEMITTTTVSGVNLAMAHGHKITGNEGTWLATQSQALTHRARFIPDLWLTAHKHHANVQDFGPYTRIQATTEDPGSKWLYDAKGVYSTPGTTVFLTGEHLPMKWTGYEVIA